MELSERVQGVIPFLMLSNPGGRVGKAYSVFDEDAGIETRGRFINDPKGVVQGNEVLTPPVGRNVEESFRQVQALLIRDTKGTEAMPSGWKPGKATLEPGPVLDGKFWEV